MPDTGLGRLVLRDVVVGGCPKSDSDRSEDAAAVDAAAGRLAVADGASSAPRAGEWAAHLVDRWVADPDAADLGPWLARAIATFDVPEVADDADWFTVEAAERSPFATLVTATVAGQRLAVVAVGDSCCFVVRDDVVVDSHPLSDAATFGSTPDLIEASDDTIHRTLAEASTAEMGIRPGDLVVLATDAIAAALLRPGRPTVREVLDAEDLPALVAQLRAEDLVDDDDVTVVSATVEQEVEPCA